MITLAENIILNKEYFELNATELATVSELVQNAEEFDEMKWFLASTEGMIAQEKITATPELKEKVMAHLNQVDDKRKFWLNGIIPFFLPEDKKFYQKPAFQMGIAALLIIGVVMIIPSDLSNGSVAMDDSHGELKEFEGNKSGEDVEFETVTLEVINDETLAEDLDIESLNRLDQSIEKPVIDEISILEEAEEMVDPMPDGYYEGKLSDDDLKKIEYSKKQNTITFGSADKADDIVTFDSSIDDKLKQDNAGGNGNNMTGGLNDANNNVPAVNTSSTTIGNNKDDAPGTDLSLKTTSVAKKEKRKNNHSRFDGEKKEFADEDSDVVVDDYEIVNPVSISAGTYSIEADSLATPSDLYDYKVYLEKNNESSEIIPYKMHVDETKELNKLFTVFK
ncbi:MAG: hypothetical protein ACI857_002287 [Arenicella sp.]|jgi:hypothetical protein